MNGPIALHGGGEYLDGDQPFLDALLDAAAAAALERSRLERIARSLSRDSVLGPEGFDVLGHAADAVGAVGEIVTTIRIAILPTAAGRGRPDRVSAVGRSAFERRSAATGRPATVVVARIIDPADADDPIEAERLASADLIHIPGGDPDLIPEILSGSLALAAIQAARRRGAVVAGASAGAMALADWTWTAAGGSAGLGFVHGLAVVPHYDDVRRTAWQRTLDGLAPGGLGYLGLDERTGVIADSAAQRGVGWRVVGGGTAHWFARGSRAPIVGRHGDRLPLPV